MRTWLWAMSAAAALLGGGCGSGVQMYEVTGAVTFEGRPVPAGDIIFKPEDASLGAESGKIQGGRYSARVKGGKNRVEIRAVREVPGKKGPMGEPLLEDYLPEAYNEKTKLTADVGPGRTSFDFPLNAKGQ